MIESELLIIRIFSKGYTVNWSRKYLLSVLFWKRVLGPMKLKIKTEKKQMESFMKKNCCGVYYKLTITKNQTVILEIKLK